MNKINIFSDPQTLAFAVAKQFLKIGNEAIEKNGRFLVALAGGSTPLAVYNLLAENDYSSQIDWNRVYFLWGDERCVPPNHDDSNYKNAYEVLIKKILLPPSHVIRMEGELDPAEAAKRYEHVLRTRFGPALNIDLILLGMGADGHTASLFPGSAAVDEKKHWVVANYVHALTAWRITLTPVLINKALNILFIVSGENKAATLKQVLSTQYAPDKFPSQLIQPSNGVLIWMVDQAAAALLEN